MVQDISAAAPADRSSALTRRIWRRALIGLGASVATPFIAAALFTGGLWLTALLVGRPDPSAWWGFGAIFVGVILLPATLLVWAVSTAAVEALRLWGPLTAAGAPLTHGLLAAATGAIAYAVGTSTEALVTQGLAVLWCAVLCAACWWRATRPNGPRAPNPTVLRCVAYLGCVRADPCAIGSTPAGRWH